MEKLYAIRDAFFWWVGVWTTVVYGTIGLNRAWRMFLDWLNRREKAAIMANVDQMILSMRSNAKPEEARSEEDANGD